MLSEQPEPMQQLLYHPLPSECTPQHQMLLLLLPVVLEEPVQPLYLFCKEKKFVYLYQNVRTVNEWFVLPFSHSCQQKLNAGITGSSHQEAISIEELSATRLLHLGEGCHTKTNSEQDLGLELYAQTQDCQQQFSRLCACTNNTTLVFR